MRLTLEARGANRSVIISVGIIKATSWNLSDGERCFWDGNYRGIVLSLNISLVKYFFPSVFYLGLVPECFPASHVCFSLLNQARAW